MDNRLFLDVKIQEWRVKTLLNTKSFYNVMFKDFFYRAEFRTKKIQSSTILRNFDGSVNKDTDGMITEKTFSLNIQIRGHKKTITFKIVSAMRDLYLEQPWLRKWNSCIDWIKLTVLMQNRYLTSRKERLKMTIV